MKIIEVTENKKEYLALLLLADEQENMIDRYLDNGRMYVLDDNGVKSECVITDEGNGVYSRKLVPGVNTEIGTNYSKIAYMRFSNPKIDSTSVIVVDETII